MAIAKDASAPAAVHNLASVSLTATTASFSPPSGSLVLVVVYIGLQGSSATMTVTAADSASVSYAAGPHDYLFSSNGVYFFTHYYASAPGSITVTATRSNAGTGFFGMDTLVLTGAASSQTGAATQTAEFDAVSVFTAAITPTVMNSWVFAAAYTGSAAADTVSGISSDAAFHDGTDGGEYEVGHAITSALTAETIGWTASGAAQYAVWVALEILPTVAGILVTLASGTGTARAPGIRLTAALAAATGTALTLAAAAGLSSATGTAWSPGSQLQSSAGLAAGTGKAVNPVPPYFGPLAEDASAPVAVHLLNSVSLTATTASFSPPSGSLIIVAAYVGLTVTNATMTVTMTDSNSVSYTAGPSNYLFSSQGIYYFAHYYASAPGSITVTATRSNANAGFFGMDTLVLTGAAVSQAGAATGTAEIDNVTALTAAITPTVLSSWVFAAITSGAASASVSGLIQDANYHSSTDGVLAAVGHAATSALTAETTGFTAAAPAYAAWAALEILPSAVGNITSGLPAGTGTAWPPGTGMTAGLATGSGTAPPPGVGGQNLNLAASLATGTGTAQPPGSQLQPAAGLAAGISQVLNLPAPSAISEDASAPVAVHLLASVSLTATTASFSPPAGSLVIVAVYIGLTATSATMTVTIADSASVSYTAGPSNYLFSANGIYYFTHYYVSAPGSITVTATRSNANAGFFGMDTLVLTGTSASQAGAAMQTAAIDNLTAMTAAITPTTANSWIFAAVSSNAATAVPAGLIQDANFHDTTDGGLYAAGHAITTALTSETIGFTAGATAFAAWAALEVLPSVPLSTSSPAGQVTGTGTARLPGTGLTAVLASATGKAQPAGRVPVINLIDNFTSNDIAALWGNSYGAYTWTAGLVFLASDVSYDQGLVSTTTFGLTGSSVYACVIPFRGSATTQTSLQVADASGNRTFIGYSAGALACFYYLAGIGQTLIGSVPYNPVSHAYWRIRESNGTLYYDASPDSFSWSGITSVANPGISLLSVSISLYAGDYGGGPPGFSYVRSVNIAASGAVLLAGPAAGAGTSQAPIPDPPNIVIDFTAKIVTTDPLGAGVCISEFSNTSFTVPLVNDATWKGLLQALAPGHCRCSIAWHGGAPNCGAGGSPGGGGPGATAIITAIKSIGAIPLVSFNGDTTDNNFVPSQGGLLVHYFNDGGGQNGGRIQYWSIGNEAENDGSTGAYESTANNAESAPSTATSMLAADPAITLGAPAASYWDQNFVQWAAGQSWCTALSFHAYDGAGSFPGTSEYGNNITTVRNMKSGALAGCEEYNWQAVGPSFSQTSTWQECVWIADVMGQIISHGGHGTVYADANGPLSIIGDGMGGTTLYQTMPAYWGIGIWTGMNGQFKRYSANVMTASTTFSATSVNAYAFDNGKIVIVNKDNAAHALSIGLTMTGSGGGGIGGGPAPPPGYTQSYYRDFTTQGIGDWTYAGQPNGVGGLTGNASFSVDGTNGLGATLTGDPDSIGLWSAAASFGPGAFIQGRVYLPFVSGQIANWPAFWAIGAVGAGGGSTDGEIDLVEGLGGAASWHVHSAAGGPGGSAPVGQYLGWHTFSALWTGGTVTFWYDNNQVASGVPLTTTQQQNLQFGATAPGAVAAYGGTWYGGPPLYPATAYLSQVGIWTQGGGGGGGAAGAGTYNVWATAGTGSPFGAIAKVVSNASFSGGLIGYTIPAGTAVSIDVTPGASSLSISTILATGTGIAQPPAYAATGGAQSLTAGLATGTGRAWAVQAQISGTGIISPVAGQTGTNYTFGANSITLTLPSGITPGNLIVACLVARNAGITVTPPARWAQAGTGAMLSGTLGAQIFCLVATSADAGLTSFTFGYSSSVGQLGTIREWNSTSGWLAAPVDQVSAIPAYNSATVQTGTTGTTAQASELAVAVLAWISDALSESGLTAGYTSGLTVTQNFNSVREAYKILAATGTQACQETISAAENNAGFLATFMPAAGGVSGPNNVTAVLAHGTGTAWPPAYSATGGAQSLTAGLATGTGTAQPVHLQFVAGWIFVGETASATTTGTAFTVNVPAGVQNGDNLILYATGFCAGSFNVPVGWTQIYKQALGMSASHAFLLATRTAASEPASYTVTTTATAQPVVGIYAVRGGTGQVYGSALATRHTAYQSYLSTPGYTKLHNTSLLVFGYGGVNSANTGGSGLVLPSSSPDLLTGSSTADHNNFSGGTDMALLASKVTTGKLTWSPPALGMGGKTVTDLTLIDTGASQSLNLNANTDYRVHLPATGPMTGALFLRGGYNIQIIGGQINLQYPGSDAFNDTMGIYYNRGNPGHIYVEGVLIHAPVPPATASAGGSPPVASTGDGANGDCYPGPVDITWQNIRVENISGCSGGADHADVIQLYNMAGSVGHMDHVTASGNCQGINIDPDYAYQTYGLMPDSYDLRNLNMNTISNPYSGFSNRYMYFLTYHLTGATGMPVSLTNCWAWEPNGIGAQNAVWPDLSTATDGANSVYNSSTGQLSFPNSPEISGVISNGTPPGGDYVPVGTAGPGYVSPGYMSAGEAWIPTPVDSITFVLELAAALPGSQLTAGLAHAVGTAQPPTIAGAVGILAGLANATGAASPLTTGLTAGLASGTGKAWPPFPSINGSQNLVARLASATGIAWPPGIQLTAGLAGGTGAAGAATSRQVISSPALESYGFGTFPQVPPGSAIQSVIATIVQYGSNASVLAPSYQLWNGTSAMIGSAQPGTASTTPGNTDVVSFTGVTYAQLATLRLRVIGSSYTGNTGATLNVDAVSLSVVWLPGVNSVILPLTLAVIPVFPAPVVTATVNAHVFPGVFAAGVPAFPAPSIGVKNATALPSALAVVPAFPAAVASTALSASVTPGVLAVIPAFPAITDVTGENWAASEDIATSGTGSWTNAGNVTGSPDSSTATWTAP